MKKHMITPLQLLVGRRQGHCVTEAGRRGRHMAPLQLPWPSGATLPGSSLKTLEKDSQPPQGHVFSDNHNVGHTRRLFLKLSDF